LKPLRAKNRWHTQAIVTVRFVSDQENVLRDAGGKVVGGAEGKVEENYRPVDLRPRYEIDGSELDTG